MDLARWLQILLLAAGGCAGLLGEVTRSLPPANLPGAPSETVVPDLIGMTRAEAAVAVKAAGFTLEVESSTPLECEGAPRVEGKVSCQRPSAGALVSRHTLVQINVFGAQRIAGAIVRAELLALIGKPPAEARSALAGYGHDGPVKVEPGKRFDSGCAAGKVCGFDVPESGMGVHDPITLFVNPGLSIAAPPPSE